jgi:hypothetical protein
MQAEQVEAGRCYNLSGYGHCIVTRKNRNGFWVIVWGGPAGDKQYTVKGVKASDLFPKPNGCK